MVYKDTKPSEKDGEERENWTNKMRTPLGNERQSRPRLKTNNEQPSSLEALRYIGKDMDDPRVKLKLLQLTPRNQAEKTSTGVQEFVKHMTNIIRDTKYPFPDNNNAQRSRRFFVKNEEKYRNRMSEKPTRRIDDYLRKNAAEEAKPQKINSPRKLTGLKPKSPNRDSHESKADNKNVTAERNRNQNVEGNKQQSQQETKSNELKREFPKMRSVSETASRKRLKPSEIPLLKSRPYLGKKPEIVKLLVKKPLTDNDSTTSVDLCQNSKNDRLRNVDSEIVVDETSEQTSESSVCLKDDLKRSNMALEPPATSMGERRSARGNRPKILDLERMKTSSFTVLRTESDSFSRLESFHKQNLTAKEVARAETAIKTSRVTVKASKTSFTSIHSKKNSTVLAKPKRSKSVVMNNKKRNSSPKNTKSSEKSETPYLDIHKDNLRTGKDSCLSLTKTESKENSKAKTKDNSSARNSPKENSDSPKEKVMCKAIPKKPVNDYSKRYNQKPEKVVKNNSRVAWARERSSLSSAGSAKKPSRRPSDAEIIENASKLAEAGQKTMLAEILDEEKRMSARDLADLVITGTALNFDGMEEKEKTPEVDKIKLEIKIDVPSEEEMSDSDGVECDSSENISGSSVDWFFKVHNNENKASESGQQKEKVCEGKLQSVFPEGFASREWEPGESSIQKPHRSLSAIKRRPNVIPTVTNKNASENKSDTLSGDSFNCGLFFHSNNNKPDTKVRSGLTRFSNTDEKLFEDLSALKLKRRNSEPHSMRGFIWKRADINSPKSQKPSMSSVASSLRHLNTDEIDDFIFWEAVPQKFTSCWEMSLYHFKRPWSVLSCSVFKDNRRSNTPGLILDTLRGGGVTNLRRPIMHQNDRINRRKENIFDVEPSISQKNIDIRNWLTALNFTSPLSNPSDVVNEYPFCTSAVSESQKQENVRPRNVPPHFRTSVLSQDKLPEKKRHEDKQRKFDRWYISDMDDLKDLIRRESGSYVTSEKRLFSELSGPKSTVSANARNYTTIPEKLCLEEKGDRNTWREANNVEKVESSCQSDPLIGDQMILEETPAPLVGPYKIVSVDVPPDINVWKYLFFFTLMFIIFHYSLGNNVVMRS